MATKNVPTGKVAFYFLGFLGSKLPLSEERGVSVSSRERARALIKEATFSRIPVVARIECLKDPFTISRVRYVSSWVKELLRGKSTEG